MIVKGEGDLKAKIWIIGEAPGVNEALRGKPFIGGAGLVLNSMLEQVGIRRENCYIDNIMQTQPPKNHFGAFYIGADPSAELMQAHVRIKTLLGEHRPNVILALGEEALFALTGKRGILKWRGSILTCNGIKIIPTLHPALIMKQFEYRPQMVFDLQRAQEQSKSPKLPEIYKDNFIINPTFSQVMQNLKFLHTQEFVSFDIETDMVRLVKHKFAETHPITCLGFGWSKQDAICIPLYYNGIEIWSSGDEFQIIQAMRELFANPKIKFIAQNAQFDMTNLAFFYDFQVANLYTDTMIAQHCVYPELPKSLAFLTSIYTQRPYHKDMGKLPGADSTWIYNCLDCVTTWESARAIVQEAKEFKTWDFYLTHSHELIKPLMNMQLRGVLINTQAQIQLEKDLTQDLITLESKLNKVVGYSLNPASPKQMQAFLYDDLKLPPVFKKGIRKGKQAKVLSANEETLLELHAKYPNPVFQLIIDIRGIRKILGTYVKAILGSDNRIRCAYKIDGTDTGRLASTKSIFNSGTNLQNIPRGPVVRQLFIPDPGMKFIEADLSQAEARVVAYLSEDMQLMELFNLNGDIHKHQAGRLFHKQVGAVTPEERQKGKTVVHASNYKVTKRRLAKTLGCSEMEAQGFINQYFMLYPKIKIWHMDIDTQLKKTRVLCTPYGRKRMFFGRFDDALLRSAIAFVPQSTVSDLINLGLTKAWRNLPVGWEILMQVHDSILIQAPVETPNEIITKFCMFYLINPMIINNRKLIIPIDIKIGKDWGHMEKII